MKPFIQAIFMTTALGSCFVSLPATAEQKIAVVDVQGVFQGMPQSVQIQQEIAEEFKDRMEEVKQIEADLKYNMEKLERDGSILDERERQDLEAKITYLRRAYADKAQPLQNDMQMRSTIKRNEILSLIKQAIDAEAASGGFTYVLNADAVVFQSPGETDLTERVLKRLTN